MSSSPLDEFTKRIESSLPQAKDDKKLPDLARTIVHRTEQEEKSPDGPINFGALWRAFIVLATNQLTTDDPSKLDRLASLARAIKDLGEYKVNGKVIEYGDLKAWHEVPGLGLGMREEWNNAPPKLSTEQWANLNGFAARLTAREVADFSLYAIWTMRDALETPRPLTERQTGDGDAAASKPEDVSADELLPAVLQWLEAAGDLMVSLTIKSQTYTKPGQSNDPARLGKLANDSGIAKGGYSVRRWKFWRTRLQEISQAKDDSGGREKIAKLAYQGLQKMETIDKEVMVMNEDMDGLHGARDT